MNGVNELQIMKDALQRQGIKYETKSNLGLVYLSIEPNQLFAPKTVVVFTYGADDKKLIDITAGPR